MNPPNVSVLIVSWNHGDLLRLAVESMLHQTWRDLEVLVVDNGSKDGSIEALQAAVGDSRLRVDRLPENRGIAAGINHGARLCRGRFIALMDSDDTSHPRRIELQMAALEAEPGLTGVCCDIRLMDGDGRPLGELCNFHTPEEIRLYAGYNMPFHHPALLLQREIFDRLQYRSQFEISADFDFIARAVQDHRFASLPLLLYNYRRHPGSVTLSRPSPALLSSALVRVAIGRRAAGRAEDLDGLRRLYEQFVSTETPVWRAYLRLAALGRDEGAYVIACLHAALAVREKPGLRTAIAYAWSLLVAMIHEPQVLRLAFAGMTKGPFWLLLKRRGFPAFPRY